MRKIAFLAILLFAVSLCSAATVRIQPLKTLGVAQGLPGSTVNSTYQDEFGMVWIGTQDGLARYDGHKMTIFRPVSSDPESLYNNNIKIVTGDGDGHIFIVAKFALCVYDMRLDRFSTLRKGGVRSISWDTDRLWVATSDSLFLYRDGGLSFFYAMPETGEVIQDICADGTYIHVGTEKNLYAISRDGKIIRKEEGLNIFSIYRDSNNEIWACTRNDGVWRFPPVGEPVHLHRNGPSGLSLSSNFVRSVCGDGYGSYWIATMDGVDIYDAIRHKLTPTRGTYPYNYIMCDSQKTLWLCGQNKIVLYNKDYDIFKEYNIMFDGERNIGIRSLTDYPPSGKILAGTSRNGVLEYDEASDKFKPFSLYGSGEGSPQNITSISFDESARAIYVGTQISGLIRIDTGNSSRRVYRPTAAGNIQMALPCGGDSVLVATDEGVRMLSLKTGESVPAISTPSFRGKYATAIFLDRQGNCWVGTSSGLLKKNIALGKEQTFFTDTEDLLGTCHVTCFFQDSGGDIWMGTSGAGIIRYNSDADTFSSFTTASDGLISDFILKIGESASGYIQIASSAGYSKFNKDNGHIENFPLSNLFPLKDIVQACFCSDGRTVVLCGHDSMISFSESDIKSAPEPQDIYFTDLSLAGKEAGNILFRDRIDLYNRQELLSIGTSTPDFLSTCRIRYRIRELNRNYVYSEIGQPITYTNLTPGIWHLDVETVSRSGSLSSASRTLIIRVHEKWFLSVPMLILYVLMLIGIILFLLLQYVGRLKLRSEVETNASKLRFFTYISHEIRTPVTLIQGSVEHLLKKGNVQPSIYNRIVGIQRNLDKINNLLGELLDFRKQEEDSLNVCFSENNFVSVMERTGIVFREYAQTKEIDFEFENRCGEELKLWFDEEQIDKVLYNLLSNAFKNTPKNGSIRLVLEETDTVVIVKVTDTGVGIPKKDMDFIFTPFHQVSGNKNSAVGTGLGLAITKGIVEGHGGSIECQSSLGKGTTFTVILPKGDAHFPEDSKMINKKAFISESSDLEVPDKQFFASVQESIGTQKPVILIVEDNEELMKYLKELFSPIYTVITAVDGIDALSKLKIESVDIILSDLMMPNMDGNELCTRVRENLATSHIPFVMLTARTSQESTLESLRNGVDEYITKPFNAKILISKCNNIVNTRVQLQHKFATSPNSRSAAVLATNKMDDDFIRKATQVVSDNISNSEFGVEEFASEMAIGRTVLFSKIKGVTGQTPNKFIMMVKLKKALELLESTPGISTSEVTYLSGFSSPSYFIKTFKSVYGMTPSAYKGQFHKQ